MIDLLDENKWPWADLFVVCDLQEKAKESEALSWNVLQNHGIQDARVAMLQLQEEKKNKYTHEN